MIRIIRQNLSKTRHEYHDAQGIVVSIPKCGRTWLRVMVIYYYCTKLGIPFDPRFAMKRDIGIPSIVYSHDLWRHRRVKTLSRRLKGKFLIPRAARASKPIVLMTRDLRDVMVSMYFHFTKREKIISGTLSEMIDDPEFGIEAAVDIINSWWEEWNGSDLFLHLTYEDLTAQPEDKLTEVLMHVCETTPDRAIIARTVEFSSFENMQRMERDQQFSRGILRPSDLSDPDSFKVRRGVVGGWVDYMCDQDIHIVENAMKRLKAPSSVH